MEYFGELLMILNEMSPYLLLGFFISGILHVYVPKGLYARFLYRKGFGSLFRAALLGVPLPLCSCGVIPTSVSLKKEGASDGAVVSFLIATPQTGVDSILATYSLLGSPFAIIRPIAAFVVAIFSGTLVDVLGGTNGQAVDRSYSKPHSCSCGCCRSNSGGRFWQALRYGYVDMIQDFGKWLVIGLLVAAAITAFVPDSLFTIFKDRYILNILLILVISTPMYICATGSIPIALSLMLKGLSPGAAFVLLMVGPATNIASLIILRREIGLRKTIIYLFSITLGAIICAFVIDFILPQDWFTTLSHCDHNHSASRWWQTVSSVIFITLFMNATIQRCRKVRDMS